MLGMMASQLMNMNSDELCQWLESQDFPADVVQSFRGNVGRFDRLLKLHACACR